jgi:hypothetical protein
VRPINDDGRAITRDLDGFPITCSGNTHDSMVVLKQESRFAKATDQGLSHVRDSSFLFYSLGKPHSHFCSNFVNVSFLSYWFLAFSV